MKKAYKKPFAQKVAFSYEDQVMAQSGNIGNIGNKDNTGVCQQKTNNCNFFWNVPSNGYALYTLYDCKSWPIDE